LRERRGELSLTKLLRELLRRMQRAPSPRSLRGRDELRSR
jgi:hypothetical protein